MQSKIKIKLNTYLIQKNKQSKPRANLSDLGLQEHLSGTYPWKYLSDSKWKVPGGPRVPKWAKCGA